LADPRVNLHIEDGRNLLLIGREKYDVIISQPSNPWQTGNANLFTAEYYRLAAGQLAENGIFGQWLGLYDITPDNLKIACNTFLSVFPYTLTFKVGSDLIMVGAAHPLAFDYRNLAKRIAAPRVNELLSGVDIKKPGDLIARHYFLSDDGLRTFVGTAPINTDMRPILEYSFRYNLGEKMFGELKNQNLAALETVSADQSVPLINLGASNAEMVAALRELGKSYSQAGKGPEARFFMKKTKEYEELLAEETSRIQSSNGG
jgi:spermidine synthase